MAAPEPYTVYASRFLLLLLFALSSAANAFLWISFAPIFSLTGSWFSVSSAAVNWLSLVFMVLYLPGSLFAAVSMERLGLRATLLLGVGGNAAGAWLRYAGAAALPRSGGGFALAMAGQVLAALVQAVFVNAPARIAADWFPRKERDTATVVASLSNAVGSALGSVLPTLFVAAPGDLPAFLLGTAVALSALLLASLAGVRADRPPTPPTAAAALRARALAGEAARSGGGGGDGGELSEALLEGGGGGASSPGTLAGVLRAYADLLKRRNFLLLTVGFGVGLGLFNAMLTLLSQLLAPCGYSDNDAGTAGAVLLGAGLLVAAGAGAALEATRAYAAMLRGGMAAATCALLLFLGALRPGQAGLVLGAVAVLGAFLIPLLPIALENAAESTFPVPEDVSSGLLLNAGNYIGLALTLGMAPLIGGSCTSVVTPAAGLMVGVQAVAVAALAGFKGEPLRQEAEAREREAEKAAAAAAAAASSTALD
jgi:FLVCR family MFS transporter 7